MSARLKAVISPLHNMSAMSVTNDRRPMRCVALISQECFAVRYRKEMFYGCGVRSTLSAHMTSNLFVRQNSLPQGCGASRCLIQELCFAVPTFNVEETSAHTFWEYGS